MTNRYAKCDGSVSKAEYAVFAALSQSETARGMTTQQPIILAQTEDGIKFTIPDFLWREKRKAVYLDGPVHLKDRAVARDNEIDDLMFEQNWGVCRIKYEPPLQGTELEKVVEQIKQFIGE